jgi:RNA polymerase sigma-70 factor (ECF subfamily)
MRVPTRSRDGIAVLDRDAFARLVEPLIPGLRLHCYRLVGSLDDAEDMVQEALVRAWRHRDRLADLGAVQPWLYRIATNLCLDLLDRQRRRATSTLDDGRGWPDPVPDAWFETSRGGGDPADALIRRETVGLAFLTAVQRLPPRQRAMLVLRDVLEWSARDVAAALDTTVAAVYSGVRRARTAIRADSDARAPSTAERTSSDVARRYLDAWERADMTALADLLAVDARMAMPPDPGLFEGPSAIIRYFEAILAQPPERRIRLLPTSASGLPAFIVLAPDKATDTLRRIGVKVIMLRGGRIAEIRGYMRPDLADRFEVHRRSTGGRHGLRRSAGKPYPRRAQGPR